jgi:small subunit ribosomal protein S7
MNAKYKDSRGQKTLEHSELLERLINKVMWDGKKTVATRICKDALDIVAKKLNCSQEEALEQALDKVKPILEVKSKRVGGATYQVPIEITQQRAVQLAIRWLVDFARAKSGKSMTERLASEMLQAIKGEGSAIKKREDTHRMAEANKAFAHYRW